MSSKTALVTGAARRLGAEIARFLAARSFQVIVHVRNSEADGRRLVEDIEGGGGHASLVVGDLSADSERERLLREIDGMTDGLDILVNNASAFEYDFPGKGQHALLRRSLEIHAIVPFMLIEHFANRATGRRQLDVFNILDQRLEHFNPDYYSYTVGKAALRAITRCWQVSQVDGVRVFGILPGTMYPSGPQTEEAFHAASRANLLGHAPAPGDVCEAIAFFHANPALTAQDLIVDGGEHLTRRDRDPAFDRRFIAIDETGHQGPVQE
jgi:NAD(P)-dependent dehydrogenase (short-subunit alcohol dehydrogenase family)